MNQTTPETFLGDVDVREIDWAKPSGAPASLTTVRVSIGNGADGLEVALATAHSAPRADEVRRLWSARWARRAAPVLLVAAYPTGTGAWKASVCGTKDDPAVIGDLDLSQVERICTVALDAPDSLLADRTLHRLLVGQKDQLVAGLTNSGLFASHELRAGVPARADWAANQASAAGLLNKRGHDLIRGLGYTTSPHGSTALLLTAQGAPRSVAVLLDEQDLFDRPAARFGSASPISHGLAIAQANNVPWLVLIRGTQLRLYTAKPNVGIGRKGQTETYTEIDLALLAPENAAYLTLLFSADALVPDGTVAEILAASADHAAALGQRLRERVYQDVVPGLAKAVAGQMGATTEDELDEAYHRTLIILFRLLFIAYAEDRGLLPYQRNPRYTAKALKTRAREFADDPDLNFDAEATDRWEELQAVWKAVDDGNREWDVPAYNGGLFASSEDHPSGRALARMCLTNTQIGPALRDLLIDDGPDGLGPVDFRSLSVREFGTIYEGLLESSLSLAPVDLIVDERTKAYLPAATGDTPVVRAGEVYFHNASGARKSTGSYFTKQFAVEHLLDASLEPAITDHLDRVAAALSAADEARAADLFFDFRIADLAMGSGHFLVAAIDRIEARFSAFLATHPIPAVSSELDRLASAARTALGDSAPEVEIEASALLRRQIARRCIYGIDLNLMAVELARLGIWIHTFVPGLPMSALDHGLAVGNSLTGIGTLDEVLSILDPDEGGGTISLFEDEIVTALGNARERLLRAARTAEATKAEVREAARAHAKARADVEDVKYLLDASVAVRVGLIDLPTDPDAAITAGRHRRVQDHITSLNAKHLPLLFPEVFLRERPGFDVVLGNPPWEKIKTEEHRFWGLRFPGLLSLAQRPMWTQIEQHKRERPDLLAEYEREVELTYQLRNAIAGGPYPGIGTGDIDLYQAFCLRTWSLAREDGRIGVVLPRSALSGSGTAAWRTTILDNGEFSAVTMLTNSNKWVFDEVHPQYGFALVGVRKGTAHAGTLTLDGPYHSLEQFQARAATPVQFPASEFKTWTAGAAFPALPDAASLAIFRQLRLHPRLDATDGFTMRPLAELHATGDKGQFSVDLDSPRGDMPVYKGMSFDLWQPDTGTYYGWAKAKTLLPFLQAKRVRQARTARSAFAGMPVSDANTLPCLHPRIAFRNVTNQTNRRTVIAVLVPPNVALTHGAPYFVRRDGSAADEAYLLGVLCSIPLDWYARRVVELNLVFEILNAFPVPRPAADHPLRQRVITIAGRLAAVDNRYADWAAAVGVPVASVTDETTRNDLTAELDAVVALLYGLTRDAVEHLYATFHRGWDYQPRLIAVLSHYDSWKAKAAA